MKSVDQDFYSTAPENFSYDTVYKVLNIMNVGFPSKGNNWASRAKLNDGYNDILMLTNDKSRCQLITHLLAMETGDYFERRSGAIKTRQGLKYFKSDGWRLDPGRKGPVPEGVDY